MNITDNEIKQTCGMCGRDSHIKLSEDELEGYKRYLDGGRLIQDCLPTLNVCEREFLKSGYYAKCQELLFGNGESKRF